MRFLGDYGFPSFGTNPGIRPPLQGSDPGLRMPTGEAPMLNTQFGQPNAQLLGLAANIFNKMQQRPQQEIPQPSGLLQPMQQMGDFRSLYANYLKQRGLLT